MALGGGPAEHVSACDGIVVTTVSVVMSEPDRC